ncbi:MAG: Stk1 family PASTA domain-containing Ser/Thr kinase [Clostridia bacterium]|nr:Stk1 family PASTA domain-containing Ser/Thr kinase [Clostridia bacterium]
MIGEILDNRYEILEIVGSGGMAVVYKAKCRLLNRFVAIKMLRSELKDDTEFVERFRVEAQSAASLNHSNIVSVYDVGQHDGRDYFVMEFVDGITLKELIKNRQISWQEACKYAIQICDAIDHAHKKNIVHRDIKPHNIIITNDNVAKVTDFGIARAVTSSTIVRAGNIIGSVHYFSPEQACGGVVDFKSDIYSIGVVLYEMLAGRIPFDAESPVAIAKMHVDNMPERPSDFNADVPSSVSDIVLKAMSKQPVMRYQSASDFAKDLHAVLESPEAVSIQDDDATQFVPIVTPKDPHMYDNTQPTPVVTPEPTPTPRKKSNGALIAWIVAGFVIIAAIVAVVTSLMPTSATIDVPNLVGQKYADVVNQYKDASFTIVISQTKTSNEGEDIILEQNPSSGQIREGQQISVVVSSGSDMVTLSDYTGKDINEVMKMLDALGIAYETEYKPVNNYAKNEVFQHSPGNGSKISRNKSVTLYVSSGIPVPDLSGLSKDRAITLLRDAGLTEGEINETVSSAEEGTVFWQSTPKETPVDKGTAISFTISKVTSPSTPTPPASSRPALTPAPPSNQ